MRLDVNDEIGDELLFTVIARLPDTIAPKLDVVDEFLLSFRLLGCEESLERVLDAVRD